MDPNLSEEERSHAAIAAILAARCIRRSDVGETKRARDVMTPGTAGEQQQQNTSSYRGVRWSKQHGKWSAKICHEGRHHYLCLFVA